MTGLRRRRLDTRQRQRPPSPRIGEDVALAAGLQERLAAGPQERLAAGLQKRLAAGLQERLAGLHKLGQ